MKIFLNLVYKMSHDIANRCILFLVISAFAEISIVERQIVKPDRTIDDY